MLRKATTFRALVVTNFCVPTVRNFIVSTARVLLFAILMSLLSTAYSYKIAMEFSLLSIPSKYEGVELFTQKLMDKHRDITNKEKTTTSESSTTTDELL